MVTPHTSPSLANVRGNRRDSDASSSREKDTCPRIIVVADEVVVEDSAPHVELLSLRGVDAPEDIFDIAEKSSGNVFRCLRRYRRNDGRAVMVGSDAPLGGSQEVPLRDVWRQGAVTTVTFSLTLHSIGCVVAAVVRMFHYSSLVVILILFVHACASFGSLVLVVPPHVGRAGDPPPASCAHVSRHTTGRSSAPLRRAVSYKLSSSS